MCTHVLLCFSWSLCYCACLWPCSYACLWVCVQLHRGPGECQCSYTLRSWHLQLPSVHATHHSPPCLYNHFFQRKLLLMKEQPSQSSWTPVVLLCLRWMRSEIGKVMSWSSQSPQEHIFQSSDQLSPIHCQISITLGCSPRRVDSQDWRINEQDSGPGALSESSLSPGLLCIPLEMGFKPQVWSCCILQLPLTSEERQHGLGTQPQEVCLLFGHTYSVRQVYIGILLQLKQLYLDWWRDQIQSWEASLSKKDV